MGATGRRAVLTGAIGTAILAHPWVARAQAEIRIRFAHSLSAVEPAHQAAEFFARNVAERTANRVRIEVFPGEQLGSGRDVNEMIRQGANVMNITDPGYLSDFVPDVGILNGPYIVDEPAQFAKLLDSDWYRGVDQRLQAAGFRMVMLGGFFGARHMIADKPIRTPADMAGMTVRVPPNQMWIETFRALGARPTTVQWSEIYNALQQNVVQAAEAPYGSLWGARLQEVRKVISNTAHFQAILGWPMNNGYFNRLPAEIRTILLEEGAKARTEQTRLTLAQEAGFVERFQAAGVQIVGDIDTAGFRRASEATYRAFPRWTPGLHETVRRILA
jgi:tripartite ATP-independent transporter DctP family solute receptor